VAGVALFFAAVPTLRRARGTVEGVLAVVNSPTLARLAAYEGGSYRLTSVIVQTAHGTPPPAPGSPLAVRPAPN
jgi:hypothetical protein